MGKLLNPSILYLYICRFVPKLMNHFFSTFLFQAGQWHKAIEVILLWCFSHNFTVRLYALLALKRVWRLEKAQLLAENEQCSTASLQGLATVVEACLHQAEVMQNTG